LEKLLSSYDNLPQQIPPESGVWLGFGDRGVEIHEGETLIGRSASSGVVLDDPLVSRTHARIVVRRGGVTIEDLKSANGVLVNGEPLLRARVLVSGDRVVIGEQSFVVFIATRTEPPPPSSLERRSPTVTRLRVSSVPEEERSEATRKGDAIDLLGNVAEKVLALGRGDEAERILSSYLRNLLQTARVNGVDAIVAEKAATYAVRLAETTGKGTWVDYTFELYGIAKRPLPGPIVDGLYASLRRTASPSIKAFREYLSVMRTVGPKLGPSDRFLMRRVEGLEALSVFK
jgi:pSer/pThr/pTyr-binding forkhead associated (FHA) protein